MRKIEILVADDDEAQTLLDVLTEAEEEGIVDFPFNTTTYNVGEDDPDAEGF